ncbi:MAG: hybrid sensor histidine kinase/response regulator, partial [Ignavibacteriae bacterium]
KRLGSCRRVEQIFLFVINNSIKFIDHGSVQIDCRLRDQRFVTCIKDTGIGIRDKEREKLF